MYPKSLLELYIGDRDDQLDALRLMPKEYYNHKHELEKSIYN